ncbi:MAG: hypothetical protein ABI475_02250 [Methylophilaceae bacterium]
MITINSLRAAMMGTSSVHLDLRQIKKTGLHHFDSSMSPTGMYEGARTAAACLEFQCVVFAT